MITIGRSKSCFVVLMLCVIIIAIRTYMNDIEVKKTSMEEKEQKLVISPVLREPWETWGIDQSPMYVCNDVNQRFEFCGRRLNSLNMNRQHGGYTCTNTKTSVDIVFSHFNKPVIGSVKAILSSIPSCKRPLRFFIYSKGVFPMEEKHELETLVDSRRMFEISKNNLQIHFSFNLSNVGRCDHTYLYHITQRYLLKDFQSSLKNNSDYGFADVNVFMKDTTSWHRHLDVQSNVLTMLSMNFHPDSKISDSRTKRNSVNSSLIAWCPREVGIENSKFELKEYKSEQCSRFGKCYDNELNYKRASIRPLDKWLYHMNIIQDPGVIVHQRKYESGSKRSNQTQPRIRIPKLRRKPVIKLDIHVCLGGIFATTSRGLRHTSLDTYNKLLKEMSFADSLEAGHYMERAWFLVFGVNIESIRIKNGGSTHTKGVEPMIMNQVLQYDHAPLDPSQNSKLMAHRNVVGIILILRDPLQFDNRHNCFQQLPKQLSSRHLRMRYFVLFIQETLTSSTDRQSHQNSSYKETFDGWEVLTLNEGWEMAVIAPHRLSALRQCDYVFTFDHTSDFDQQTNGKILNQTSSSSSLVQTGQSTNLHDSIRQHISICGVTQADIRVAVGSSLTNGAGISFPTLKYTNSTKLRAGDIAVNPGTMNLSVCDWSRCRLNGNCDEACSVLPDQPIYSCRSNESRNNPNKFNLSNVSSLPHFFPKLSARRMSEAVNGFCDDWLLHFRSLPHEVSTQGKLLHSLQCTWQVHQSIIAPLFFEGGLVHW